ncbi:MAG: hypothetical protein K6A38_08155 [Lachnospiraceae bacterium]|nr:hypothetical protein [Lachnospiraceae bacterium]
MKKVINISTAIKALILTSAILFVLSVYPCRMWTEDKTFGTPLQSGESSPVINYLNDLTEVFVASDTHLQSIRVYIDENTYTDKFELEITDGNGKHINTVEVDVPEALPGYVDVVLDVDTTPSELYILKFRSLQSLYLATEIFVPESQVLVVPYYNDTPLDGKACVIDFEYRVPVSTARSFLIIGIVVLTALVLWAITDKVMTGTQKDSLVTVETAMKNILNPLTAVLLVACIGFIARGYVSEYAPDNVFAVISVILLGLLLFYAINHKRGIPQTTLPDYLRTHSSGIIQSIGIAFAIQACCEYVAGLYDIHHRVAERKEMIGFAIALIAMFAFSEVFNLYNLIYVVISVIGALIYYRLNVTPEMTPDDRFVLKGNAIVAILLGFILIRTVKGIIQKKLTRPLIPCTAIAALTFVMLVVFRNTRWWTVALVVSFTLFFLNYSMWDKKETLLANVVRGVSIQFILCTIWCWLYRPYTTFWSARYTHFFHTETITATYMTVVSSVSIVLLLSKILSVVKAGSENGEEKATVRLADIWKELVLFGTATSYLLFTITRTAYAATIAAFAFALIMTFISFGKGNIRACLKTLGFMCLGVLVMFPITYEIQRTVPVLVSKPYVYDIEEYTDKTLHGRDLASSDYMMIGRFGELFCEKMLGMEEHSFKMYYHYKDQPEVNEYNATMKQLYGFAQGYKWDGLFITDEQWDELPTHEMFVMYIDRCEEMYGTSDEEYVEESPEASSDEAGVTEASAEDGSGVADETVSDGSSDEGKDYTSGRMDIFRSYIKEINMTGHDTMGATLESGEIASHAHDVYLQIAFDHGIPTMIIFLIFGLTVFIYTIIYCKKSNDRYAVLPGTMIVAFAVAGVVEWVFHLSHPLTFTMLLSMVPTLFPCKDKEKR